MAKRLVHLKASEDDIFELVPQMRKGDIDEVLAGDGDLVRGCLNSLYLTPEAIAMRDHEGALIAVYGATPTSMIGSTQAAPWLLGTERMRDNQIAVFHDMKLYLAHLSEHYQRLFNYVDARNVESVGWLARLGFTTEDPVPQGPNRLPFHPFWMDLG